MQKQGAVQKGFFLVVFVLLAAAFLSSQYSDATGQAFNLRNRQIITRQPGSVEQFGSSNVQTSADMSVPSCTNNECGRCSTHTSCTYDNSASKCACLPDPGWKLVLVNTGVRCGTADAYEQNPVCPKASLECGANEECNPDRSKMRPHVPLIPCYCYENKWEKVTAPF